MEDILAGVVLLREFDDGKYIDSIRGSVRGVSDRKTNIRQICCREPVWSDGTRPNHECDRDLNNMAIQNVPGVGRVITPNLRNAPKRKRMRAWDLFNQMGIVGLPDGTYAQYVEYTRTNGNDYEAEYQHTDLDTASNYAVALAVETTSGRWAAAMQLTGGDYGGALYNKTIRPQVTLISLV